MKILVTGAAGFLGSHLVDRLLADGHEVVGVDNFLTGSWENIEHHARNSKFDFVERDIVSPELCRKLMTGVDVVFNTAAIARTPWTIEDPILSHDVNTTAVLYLLEAARHAGVKRFVHSSSCIVYVPNTPYYVSKLCAEEYVLLYQKLYGLSTIALRYQNLYGKRQSEKPPHPNVFASLRASKKAHGKLFITGNGEQTRDYTHVSDAVEANILAMEKTEVYGAMDICRGRGWSLNAIAPYFGVPVEYIAERTGDIKDLLGNPQEAKEKLGFVAKVNVEEGIADVL